MSEVGGNYASPANEATAITLDVPFEICRAIYVGVAGDVSAVMAGPAANTILFKNAQAGSIIPIRATMVTTVGGTATSLVALR